MICKHCLFRHFHRSTSVIDILKLNIASMAQLYKLPLDINGLSKPVLNGYHHSVKDTPVQQTGQSRSIADIASDSLHQNKVIGVPTDTIYGIAGLAQSTEAVEKIYAIKIRQTSNPVAICVADTQDVKRWAKVTISDELLEKLLPGPVTLVFERLKCLNPNLNPNTTRVGVRIPDQAFLRELCRKCDGPLALTSANLSGKPSTLSVDEFSERLQEELAVIIDGGRLGDTEEARQGSTVVDLSCSGTFTIIRPGSAEQKTRATLLSNGLEESNSR